MIIFLRSNTSAERLYFERYSDRYLKSNASKIIVVIKHVNFRLYRAYSTDGVILKNSQLTTNIQMKIERSVYITQVCGSLIAQNVSQMTQEIKEKTEAAEMKRAENKAKKKLQSEIFLKSTDIYRLFVAKVFFQKCFFRPKVVHH